MTAIRLADSDNAIQQSFPVMQQLRPHLTETDFVARVRRQQTESGYQLAVLSDAETVRAVAGFRMQEFLAWGRILYVDDLITDAATRSCGYGQELLDWLIAYAREQQCLQLHLDSGVQRFDAHRFYLKNRMRISAHHFSLEFDEA